MKWRRRAIDWDLGLSGGDGNQFEQLPALGVGVERGHGVLGCLLNLGRVGTPLEPAAQERHLFWVQHRHTDGVLSKVGVEDALFISYACFI